VRARAGVDTRLPTGTATFELDDQVGEDVLYVIASTRPLELADPTLAGELARSAKGGACPTRAIEEAPPARASSSSASAPPPAPTASAAAPPIRRAEPHGLAAPWKAGLTRRGITVAGDTGADAESVASRADDDGIVVQRIGFTHRR
jgi:hypothetical protein